MSEIKTVRQYATYQEYLDHQSEKSNKPAVREKLLGEGWEPRYRWFLAKFRRLMAELYLSRGSVYAKQAICLGARFGHEVEALRRLGFLAFGIDIVPYPPHIEKGDIHSLSIENSTQFFAFTNIFDHSIDPAKFASEIIRVLQPGGYAVIHLATQGKTDSYGVIELEDAEPIKRLFVGHEVVFDRPFNKTWGGLNWELVIRKVGEK